MHVLVELSPLDPATGSRVTLRAASRQDRRITNLNGVRWWPALTEMSPIRMQGFDGNFSSALQPGSVTLGLLVDKLVNLDANARRFIWAGAPVSIYCGNPGAAWPWAQYFSGVVTASNAEANALQLTAAVDTETFQRNVLTASYAGTTGAEGPADLKNVLKPFLIGRCRNVEPILIDVTNSVFQFHGYGPISAVNGLYERGSAFPAPIANYATYAALVAASIPPGQWGTCLAAGMVRLGAPPYGVITGDVDGDKPSTTWFSKTGEIINRLATNAGVSAGDIDSASLTALDSAISMVTAGGGIIGLYLTEQETVLDLASRLAAPCNAMAGVSPIGKLFTARLMAPVSISLVFNTTRPIYGGSNLVYKSLSPTLLGQAPIATFDAQSRRQPGVYASAELDVSPPYTRIEMRAARSWRVHTFDEISSNTVPTPRGDYNAGTTYREGDIVYQPSDGTTYYYINPTPTSGNAPPNASYWDFYQSGSGAPTWASITGAGKPADNATVGAPTGTNVGSTAATTVESGANAANNGVNSDGTIKTDKVGTGSIVADAVSERPYANLGSSFNLSTSNQLVLDITVPAAVAGEAQKFTGAIDANDTTYEGSMTTVNLTIQRCDVSGAFQSTLVNDRQIGTFSDENLSFGFSATFAFIDTPTSTYRRYKIYARQVDSSASTVQTSSFVQSEALKK